MFQPEKKEAEKKCERTRKTKHQQKTGGRRIGEGKTGRVGVKKIVFPLRVKRKE